MMRYKICIALLLVALFPVFALCRVSLADGYRDALRVTIAQVSPMSGGSLRLHWSIVNRSSKVVTVYGTFLHGPAAGHQGLSPTEIEVFTSLMKRSDVDVNDYPKATFLDLRPGERVEGDFTESMLVDHWAKPGERLRLDVAYGYDKDALQHALAEQAISPHGGHPANPIVDWQKIVKSGQVLLR
jgi:hypothetical protein